MRLSGDERRRLSASLGSPEAMQQLADYIRMHLSWYPFVTPDLALALFGFGRDMRTLVETADRGFEFPLHGDGLPVRTYLLFLAGFLGCSAEFADVLRRQPHELLNELGTRFAIERTRLQPARRQEAAE